MGYCIVYGQEAERKYTAQGRFTRLRTMIAASFLIFSLVVRLTWEDGTEKLRSIFMPEPLSVTEQAFSELVTDLQEGQTLSDALTIFCSTIINEAS